MIPKSSKDDFLAVISHMVGKRMVDIIGYGWLERKNGKTQFALGLKTFDFVLNTGRVVFYGDETTILGTLTPDPLYYKDYSELGEPCCASVFEMLSFAAGHGLRIYKIQVYMDVKTDLPEAFLISLGTLETTFQIFVQADYVNGLHLSSPLEEKTWRGWREKTGEEFTVLTFE